jgi:hypothetical protein
MADVHPHALKGAVVSLAAMWRLPIIHTRDPEESLLVLRLLAQQARHAGGVLSGTIGNRSVWHPAGCTSFKGCQGWVPHGLAGCWLRSVPWSV